MFWRKLVPNFSICVHLAMVIVIYLDMRNPMMGFMEGWPFLVLAGFAVLSGIASSVLLYADSRRSRKRKKASNREEIEKIQ